MQQLQPLLLLLSVLSLLASQQPQATAASTVHEVAVSVRSIRSIMYRGIQVSIFQHTQMPRRYLFQPLSFFDQASIRRSRLRVHLDVYMWTEDFVRLVESYFPDSSSVELMPLTQTRLAWSRQAQHWLGEGFNETWNLFGIWRDADKPQMRTTYTISCKTESACDKLLKHLNSSEIAGVAVLELQYRVPFMESRNATVSITSRHLQQSPTFQQLERFSESTPATQILVPASVADSVAEEALAAAVTQLQKDLRQEVAELNQGFHRSAFSRMQQLLRADAVHAVTPQQWSKVTFWPPSQRNLRPDRLARAFNALLVAADQDSTLRAKANAAEVLDVAANSLPADAANKIGDLVRAYLPAGRLLPVAKVQQLAQSLGSFVQWSVENRKFVAPSRCLMFRVDPARLAARGVLLLQEAEVLLRVSQHSDELLPMSSDSNADYSSSSVRSELSIAQQQLKQLQRNVSRQRAEIMDISQQLQSWIDAFAPNGQRGSAQIRTAAAAANDGDRVQRQLKLMQLQIKEIKGNVNSSRFQPKFADNFCVLADRRDPPNAYCRTMSYVIPRKSLRYSPLFDRRVRYQTNSVGANYFVPLNNKFLKFGLRICCFS